MRSAIRLTAILCICRAILVGSVTNTMQASSITPTAVSRCLEEHLPTARKRSRPVDDGLAACRLDGFVTTLIHTGGFEAVWTALNQSGQL